MCIQISRPTPKASKQSCCSLCQLMPDMIMNHTIEPTTAARKLSAPSIHMPQVSIEAWTNPLTISCTAHRMTEVWPSRFPSAASGVPYQKNPRALANKVYNGRMGNAAGSDDGWNFRGRGASQTTGREGYERLAKATGLDVVNNPDLVNDPAHFLECGVADFVLCGCLAFAGADDVVNVTR